MIGFLKIFRKHFKHYLRFIWTVDGTKGTTAPLGQSLPWSNSNGGMTLKSSRTGNPTILVSWPEVLVIRGVSRHIGFHLSIIICGWCPRGVMVKAMDCRIVVREFVLQSRYYVHFRANTLGKGLSTLSMELPVANSSNELSPRSPLRVYM